MNKAKFSFRTNGSRTHSLVYRLIVNRESPEITFTRCQMPSTLYFGNIIHATTYFSVQQRLERAVNNAASMAIEKPNDWAISAATEILNFLEEKAIRVKFFNPSHEGGFVIEFYEDQTYHLIDIYNDREIVYLIRDHEKTNAFDTNLNQVFDLLNEFTHTNVPEVQ